MLRRDVEGQRLILQYAVGTPPPRRHGWHVGVWLPFLYWIMVGVTIVGTWDAVGRVRMVCEALNATPMRLTICVAPSPPECVMWAVEGATVPAGAMAGVVLLRIYGPMLRRPNLKA